MPDMFQNDKKPLIVVVDDMIGNLKVVGKILLSAGLDVSMTQDSKKAIDLIEKNKPNLILLDIMMPFIDGYQICEQLKSRDDLKDIPVIFFTAKNETADIVKGFQVGGVDFIVKPANKEELLARVKTHLELKNSNDLISKQKNELEKLIVERSKFFDITLSNIKEPLSRVVEKSGYIKKLKGQLSDREFEDHLTWIEKDSKLSYQTVSDICDVNALDKSFKEEDIEYKSFSLIDMTKDIFAGYYTEVKKKRIILKINEEDEDDDLSGISVDESIITADINAVKQILDNLISNTIKFSPFYKNVIIKTVNDTKDDNEILRYSITDEGPGISRENQNALFKKFSVIKSKSQKSETSSGLGLYIVKRLVDRINGEVFCESDEGYGATFIVEFPKKNK